MEYEKVDIELSEEHYNLIAETAKANGISVEDQIVKILEELVQKGESWYFINEAKKQLEQARISFAKPYADKIMTPEESNKFFRTIDEFDKITFSLNTLIQQIEMEKD